MNIVRANYLGAGIALIILITCILIFIFRLLGLSKVEYWSGVIFLSTSLPIIYLLFTANIFHRPVIYYVQLVIMLIFIVVEFFLDYLFKVDFRNTGWMVIAYATLFFAATGGMIGIASLSSRTFSFIAILLFLVMAFLAFFQRIKTGM